MKTEQMLLVLLGAALISGRASAEVNPLVAPKLAPQSTLAESASQQSASHQTDAHVAPPTLVTSNLVTPNPTPPGPILRGAPKVVADQDTRLQTIDYDETSVVRLEGCMNFQTMIVFGANERIENVGLGDSSQWQVMPNKRANLLFVKPLSTKAFSNMTVVSDKGTYNFELRSAPITDCARGHVVYELRFHYADDPSTAPKVGPSMVPTDLNALPMPQKRNTAYTYTGDAGLVPLRVFDDGASTYMKWAVGIETPAVYALGDDNKESLINFANRGDYIVVEQVARAFVLRRGDQKVILYNDAYQVQGLDGQSPKPRRMSGGQ